MIDKNSDVQDASVQRINNALDQLVKSMEQDRLDNYFPWIVFSLNDTEYAINARYVLYVAILYEIVPYVVAPAYCPGVIWDRNGVIRLLDLHVLLGRGNYLSAVAKENSVLPMIIIIEPDGKKRGMIVEKIVVMKYINALNVASVNESRVQSMYIKGTVNYASQKEPALIISPESFIDLEFEDQNAEINWKGRIDMEMKAGDLY